MNFETNAYNSARFRVVIHEIKTNQGKILNSCSFGVNFAQACHLTFIWTLWLAGTIPVKISKFMSSNIKTSNMYWEGARQWVLPIADSNQHTGCSDWDITISLWCIHWWSSIKVRKNLNIIQIVFSFCFCFWSDTTSTHIQIIMKRIVLFVILLGEQKYWLFDFN